jgi:predicted enzyme related to lactoylglutathione lyase
MSVPPEQATTDPPENRVSGLIPFVHVADVARSAAFYRHFGFAVKSTYEPEGRLVWAALASDGAELMVALAGEPVDPQSQAVLFYLYAQDLAGLREQLLAAGIKAGKIKGDSPGPSEEMRVIDPDGYVLMVAQIAE